MPPEAVAYGKVLPLVGLGEPEAPRETQVLGTGFVATDGVLVTAWHVVGEAIESGWTVIAAWDRRGDGRYVRLDVTDITQHPARDDLATGRVDLPGAGWRLWHPEQVLDLGTDVVSMGYPLPDVRVDADGGVTHMVSFRLLKGYMTHIPIIEQRGFPPAPCFELDMPAPRGLSGGPLLHAKESNVLLGVVYQTHSVDRVESFSTIDPETGEKVPEVVQTVTFALAYTPQALWSLNGPATDGRPLGIVMRERGEIFRS